MRRVAHRAQSALRRLRSRKARPLATVPPHGKCALQSASRHLSSAESGLRSGICTASGWRRIFAMKGQGAGGGVRKPRKRPSGAFQLFGTFSLSKAGKAALRPGIRPLRARLDRGGAGGSGPSGDGKIKSRTVRPGMGVDFQGVARRFRAVPSRAAPRGFIPVN